MCNMRFYQMNLLCTFTLKSIGHLALWVALLPTDNRGNEKEIQPVHPKRNQSWVFIWRTDAEVETPIFWPPDSKSWLIGKDPDAAKDWRQEKMTEDEMDREAWCAAVHGDAKSWTWRNEQLNWTEPRKYSFTDYAEFPNIGSSHNIKKSYSINLTTNLIKKSVTNASFPKF